MARALLATLIAIVFSAFNVHGGVATSCYDQSPFDQADWPHCANPDSRVFVYAGKTSDGRFMKLGMRALHTRGWTSLAISSNGGMKGAREIVVRKDSNQQWIVEDRYSQAYATPSLASEQNVKLLFIEMMGGATSWGVLLPINSCSAEVNGYPTNVDLSKDVNHYMLWALGSSHAFIYHLTNRGTFTFNFLSGLKPAPSTAGLVEINVRMPNVDVVLGPGGRDPKNPYICTVVDMSNLTSLNFSQKHHAVKFSPILHPASKQYIHHMILLRCESGSGSATWTHKHLHVIPECESMPRGCYTITWVWAVGGEDIVLPSDVGMPIGSGVNWYVLQLHYYNPNEVAGIKDSSGVKISIQETPRQHDMGLLPLNGGTSDDMRDPLPPGMRQTISFQVPSTCTARLAHPEVTVISVFYHAHLLGTHLNIDVVRHGSQIGRLTQQNLFDFNHQSLSDPVVKTLKRGDMLAMNCTYDTTLVKKPTPFGESSQHEMCWAAIWFYPDDPFITGSGGTRHVKRKDVTDYQKDLWQQARRASSWCSNSGLNDFTNVSACAQAITIEPFMFKGWIATPSGYDAASVCNWGVPSWKLPASYLTQTAWPGLCPDCWMTQNCTREALKAHAQQHLCPSWCHKFQLSLWPNTSKSRVPSRLFMNHTDGMMCGHRDDVDLYTPTLNYSKLSCQKVGDLDSTEATSAVQQCHSCQPFVSILASLTMQLSSLNTVINATRFLANVTEGIASEFGVPANYIKISLTTLASKNVNISYTIRIPISNAAVVAAARSKDPTVGSLTSAIQGKLDPASGKIAVQTKTAPIFVGAQFITPSAGTSTTVTSTAAVLSTTTVNSATAAAATATATMAPGQASFVVTTTDTSATATTATNTVSMQAGQISSNAHQSVASALAVFVLFMR